MHAVLLPFDRCPPQKLTRILSQIENITPVAETLFPFVNVEWKRARGPEGHPQAVLQVARGASCIVNYNHTFFKHAGMEPSILDTIHFSITCDMLTVKLYVNWRECVGSEIQYHTKTISCHSLRDYLGNEDNPEMQLFRARLRSILDWALGDRLGKIYTAIDAISVKNTGEPAPKRRKM
jgi:hypothetical protein